MALLCGGGPRQGGQPRRGTEVQAGPGLRSPLGRWDWCPSWPQQQGLSLPNMSGPSPEVLSPLGKAHSLLLNFFLQGK